MLLDKIKKYQIILGSGSPRRKELLAGLGIDFIVDPKTSFIENQEHDIEPLDIPEFMAKGKSHGYHKPLVDNDILITADTIVICHNFKNRIIHHKENAITSKSFKNSAKSEVNSLDYNNNNIVININNVDFTVLEKPNSRIDAVRMLKKLSGNKHTVATGVCLRSSEKELSFTATSDVWFKELSEEEINYYIDNYQPYDKAGAYGVQEWIGYVGISKIEGSFYNVMGLPIQKVYQELQNFIL